MIHWVIGNRVTISKHKKVLCGPRDFFELSVLSQDGTAAEEMSCCIAGYQLQVNMG